MKTERRKGVATVMIQDNVQASYTKYAVDDHRDRVFYIYIRRVFCEVKSNKSLGKVALVDHDKSSFLRLTQLLLKTCCSVGSRSQHRVRFNQPKIWTSFLPFQRRTPLRSTNWPVRCHLVNQYCIFVLVSRKSGGGAIFRTNPHPLRSRPCSKSFGWLLPT